MDTPPLFIPLPPAVTLTFYFSLLIHSQIICTKKKGGRGEGGEEWDAAQYVC